MQNFLKFRNDIDANLARLIEEAGNKEEKEEQKGMENITMLSNNNTHTKTFGEGVGNRTASLEPSSRT